MTAIAKLAKIHPAAKKCCGWEEPAIWWWLYDIDYWEFINPGHKVSFSENYNLSFTIDK